MALVLCLHPYSIQKAAAYGLSLAEGDVFVFLEDAVLAINDGKAAMSVADARARGISVDTTALEDEVLIDLIYEHPFTLTC